MGHKALNVGEPGQGLSQPSSHSSLLLGTKCHEGWRAAVFRELPYFLAIVCSKQACVVACSNLPGAMDYGLVSESEVTGGVRAPSCCFELVFLLMLINSGVRI